MQHKLSHTGVKSYQCEEYGKLFYSTSKLKKHRRLNCQEKLYKCEICGKAFPTNSSLIQHRIVHIAKKHHKCEECSKIFACAPKLKRHKRIHCQEKPFKCQECGKQGLSYSPRTFCTQKISYQWENTQMWRTWKRLLYSLIPNSAQITSYWGKMWRIWQNVLLYCRPLKTPKSHTNVKNVTKSLVHLQPLRDTRQFIVERNPYKCELCGKEFTKPSLLNEHKTAHTGEKPYKCEECGKGFSCSSYVEVHEAIHSEDNAFKCGDCGKPFANHDSFLNTVQFTLDRNPVKVWTSLYLFSP